MQPDQPELYPAARGTRQLLPLYGHLIGNEWVDGNGSPLQVMAPATDKPLAWLARGGAAEIDAAPPRASQASCFSVAGAVTGSGAPLPSTHSLPIRCPYKGSD